jgi:threonine dehydratase
MSDLLTLDHISAAHARIRDSIVATPTLHSQTLSNLTGANIYLKFENLQFTAAYKARRDRGIGWQPCAGFELSRY